MGVPSREDVTDSDSKSFSKDTLKIELSGPEYEHFSVVDLPGLFRSWSIPIAISFDRRQLY